MTMTAEEREAARKATKRRYYERNREKVLAYAADYRVKNADKIKASFAEKNAEYVRRYRTKHPEKARSMTQAWKDANPERRRKTQAAWLQRNLDKHRTYQHNRRARKNEVGGKLSPDLASRLYAIQKGRCACCGASLGKQYDMDHVVPLALGGSNTDDNMQLLTERCNRQKGAKHPVEFMQSRGKLL